jgi:hypothetical protein
MWGRVFRPGFFRVRRSRATLLRDRAEETSRLRPPRITATQDRVAVILLRRLENVPPA